MHNFQTMYKNHHHHHQQHHHSLSPSHFLWERLDLLSHYEWLSLEPIPARTAPAKAARQEARNLLLVQEHLAWHMLQAGHQNMRLDRNAKCRGVTVSHLLSLSHNTVDIKKNTLSNLGLEKVLRRRSSGILMRLRSGRLEVWVQEPLQIKWSFQHA